MKAYRTYLTITNRRQIVLTNVPFLAGQRVEVLLLTQNTDYGAATQKLKGLLKETQALPHIEMMSETEIAEEIAAYRSVQ